MGQRLASLPDVFPAGANLSVLLPPEPAEIFVRTFERGAGLTASCGSGMAASRAVYSRVTRVDPECRVTVRNAGGMATVSLTVHGDRWHPVLEGNATFVYRAEVDPAALAAAVAASRSAASALARANAVHRDWASHGRCSYTSRLSTTTCMTGKTPVSAK